MTRTLTNLIKAEYFKSIIAPLLIIETMLLVAYFWSNAFVNDVTKKTLIQETKVNIEAISSRSAAIVSNEFKSISNVTALFQKAHEDFFQSYSPLHVSFTNSFYGTTKDGVIYNTPREKDSCSLFFTNIKQQEPNRLAKAIATEKLDSFYNAILKTNPNIAQLYFNSHDSMNRLCPFMPDALGQYDHNMDIPTFNFYFDADLAHNPEKKVVWTEAYLDPAGLGWMISAIAPVYKGDFLEGVVGIDVTIDNLINNILSIKLPYTSMAMLMDKNGNILAMSAKLEPLLGLKELKTHDYTAPLEQTITKPKDFNVLNNTTNSLAHYLGEMIRHSKNIEEYQHDNANFLVIQKDVQETGWKLFILIDEDSLLSSTTELKEKTDLIGYSAIAFMALFYIFFLLLVLKRSRNFSALIIHPLQTLVKATQDFKGKLSVSKLAPSHISEIDTLLENFTTMGNELKNLYEGMDKKVKEGILDNMETQKVMIYQSRLAQMGEMISMIAHQWRQPLGSISTVTASIKLKQRLKKFNLETFEGREAHMAFLDSSIDKIENYIQFLTTTIDDFRNFFKPEQKPSQTTISEIVDNALKIIGNSLEVNHIELTLQNDSHTSLLTYGTKMTQVVINIIKNAQDAIVDRTIDQGVITIHSYEMDEDFCIDIEDNAGGINQDIIEKIFDPYFSTKTEKNGTGLGLYMSKTIIEEHCHGLLKVSNTQKGVRFSIRIKGE